MRDGVRRRPGLRVDADLDEDLVRLRDRLGDLAKVKALRRLADAVLDEDRFPA